mmetsp:Transcript_75899/g.210664  ORF Transcript_75899/g.210664 Transcript_75899/m.210664 type:complete len:480 (-) Transcript_75899:94-1533(-)
MDGAARAATAATTTSVKMEASAGGRARRGRALATRAAFAALITTHVLAIIVWRILCWVLIILSWSLRTALQAFDAHVIKTSDPCADVPVAEAAAQTTLCGHEQTSVTVAGDEEEPDFEARAYEDEIEDIPEAAVNKTEDKEEAEELREVLEALEQEADPVVGVNMVLQHISLRWLAPEENLGRHASHASSPKRRASQATQQRTIRGIVEQARTAVQCAVRFSVQDDALQDDDTFCVHIAVLGPDAMVRSACAVLRSSCADKFGERVKLEEGDHFGSLFALHFLLRGADDIPYDDELLDASIEADWCNLGSEGSSNKDDVFEETRSLQAVTKARLQKVIPPDHFELHVFTDECPGGMGTTTKSPHMDIIGCLDPNRWDAATRAVLACEANGVYLSRSYDAFFWCPEALQKLIEDQIACALSHWKGDRASSDCCGMVGVDFASFEDVTANVSAVLQGSGPPGWHRLEWTPDGDGAVPHMTY